MSTPVIYPQHKLRQNNGTAVVDYDTDTIRVMIVTSAYTYNVAHDFIDDVSGSQVSGTGYTAGGTTCAGVTLALDGDNAEFAHNDQTITQNAAGFANGRVFVWYKDTGTPASSPLIMRMTEAADFGNVAGDLTLDGSAATGVLNWV